MTSRNKKLLFAAGLVIAAAGVFGVRAYRASRTPDVETVAPRRGPVAQVVSETGKVVAIDDLVLSFRRSGRVAKILVKEGEAVKQGQPLMSLETSELAIQRREALAAVSSAEAKYAQAAAGATAEELRVLEVAVTNARTSLEDARQAREDVLEANEASLRKAYGDLTGGLESGYLKSSAAMQTLKNDVYDAAGNLRSDISPTDFSLQTQSAAAYVAGKSALARMDAEIAELRATGDRARIDALSSSLIESARTVRDAAQLANALMQSSSPAGGTTQASFDARRTSVKAAWTDLNAAVNAAEALKLSVASVAAANASSANAADQAVRTAEGAVASAERTLESRKAPLRDVDRAVYLAAIASARASLSLVDQQIADSTLEAPVDGVVGTIDVSLGETAQANAPVGTLVSTSLKIESEVSELDIAGIRLDQPVAFSFDAIEGRTFAGRVLSVAPRETSKDDDIYYKVEIAIDGSDPAVRIGMTADLDIEVGRKENALLVPRRQVYRREGKDYVKVLTASGAVEEVEVTVGLRGREDYEILSGVRESDRIAVE